MSHNASIERNIAERMSIKINSLSDFMQKYKEYYSWITAFRCTKAAALQNYLRDDAIREEVHHEAKTFIIFDEEAHIVVAYFSIRTTCIIRKLIEMIDNEKKVKNIIPCMELTKLCINEQYLDFLKENKYNNKGIGTYVFKTFIVPIIVVLSSMVGFTQVILFAIHDMDEKVINAYRNHMGFETIEDDNAKIISTLEGTSLIVDKYSSECKFMYQDIDEIIRRYEGGYHYA